MNTCNDRHEPIYKLRYKPTSPGGIYSEWLVCEQCFGKEEFFGSAEEIESIVSLRNNAEIRLNIVHLSIMTRTITKKLKKILFS
jgi:hypothetical protein